MSDQIGKADRVSPDQHDGTLIPAGSIDHIAVAVPDLNEAMRFYPSTFGARLTEPVDVPDQGIRIAYAELVNARVELMQPTRPDSPVARFLQRNPKGGIHHFCMTAAAAEAQVIRLAGKPVPDCINHRNTLEDEGTGNVNEQGRK